MHYVAAIDQGTTGTRCLLVSHDGAVVGQAYETHEQQYPQPGWVEHDPTVLWENTKTVVTDALADAGLAASDLAALGVTNQRETTVLWDAATGEPIHNAIVWQDRRTTERIEQLETEWIRDRTGLEPDAYFSASKLEWLLDEVEGARERAEAGELRFGTVDSWLVSKLTGEHVTDVTNASRTMLFDIHDLRWDGDLLAEFDVPRAVLPTVVPSSDPESYGTTSADGFLGAEIPVAGVLGDQQAALFGQTCFEAGSAKNTYGTGSFLLVNTGPDPVESDHGLLTTVAFQRAGEEPRYALEGSIFTTGAAIEWLEDVSLVESPAETETLARSVDSTDGVYVVPAFSGLGAPYWDGRARGTILGLTRGTGREHIARATLESIGFQTHDVLEAMAADTGETIDRLRVDGGAVQNDLLCELQATIADCTVARPAVDETTALGAAYAAGLAVGYWEDLDALQEQHRTERVFRPSETGDMDGRYERWNEAVDRARDWAREER
ncbi:glycerol kinase GlpK [Halosegnis longus]|uniref:glycerol kinase GlpK n=1 Tax=Halosegnis longus TaxID=2216012 RepID=UPI00096A69F9|nr:glycerol kinase GlpK [Salella cibi]